MKAVQAAYRGSYDALHLVDIPRPPRVGQAVGGMARGGRGS